MEQVQVDGQPIDDQDVVALESLAEAWALERGGMPLEALDGFFSALLVGPGPLVPVSEWLEEAVGEGAQASDSAIELLLKLQDHVLWRVAQPIPGGDDDSEQAMQREFALLPFVGLPTQGDDDAGADGEDDPMAGIPRDFPVGALWASGFLQGVALRPDGWSAWAAGDEDLAHDLQDLVRLSVVAPEQAEELGLDWDQQFDFDERWELLVSVPALLQDLYLDRVEEAAAMREPVRREPMPGRNDPCTCGSGRKWKKCCGASVH